ncbi:SiaB family protein kinase [soil metagenome]
MNYVYELHKIMQDQKLILVYEGDFTQELTKSVLSMAEKNMDSMGEVSNIKRKVFNVMVECLQNIVKHTEDFAADENKQSAIFIIGKLNSKYIIASGNPVKSENISDLKEKLEKINSLDKDGLKNLYKDIIKGSEISSKGGAGLGFVDMARKSGHKLEYNFSPLDDTYSFFSLKTTISRDNF